MKESAPSNPEGCAKVAGGRSVAKTSGKVWRQHRTLKGCQIESETKMGSTFFSLHYHAVFSTKHRQPLLRDEGLTRMHSYLGGIIRGMNGVAEIVGGVADHVHLLVSLRPVHCLADVLRDLKKESTNWAKDELDRRFAWQEGYAAAPESSTTKNIFCEADLIEPIFSHPSGVPILALSCSGGLRSASTTGYYLRALWARAV